MARADEIINSIVDELGELPSGYPNPCIFKDNLRSVVQWNNIYDPEIVSIGLYNHGKHHLEDMKIYKFKYLKRLLQSINVSDQPNNDGNNVVPMRGSAGGIVNDEICEEETVGSSVNTVVRVKESAGSSVNDVVRMKKNAGRIVNAVVRMEESARKCYAGRIHLDHRDDFVKMLVIDGCFLIELLRYYGFPNLRDPNDPIFRQERILSELRHDIVLNENQLPFFVLNDLFNMSKSKDPKDDLILLTLRFVEGMFLDLSIPKKLEFRKPDHLLGLIRDVWVLPFVGAIPQENLGRQWKNINSASRLREAGIKFEKAKTYNSLMDIKFVGGKLIIPQLYIYYETKSQIGNLVAYEQFLSSGEPRYVSDYTFFLHCLINTSDDVELLRRSGIIENWMGNDEAVYLMFSGVGKGILTSSNFSYAQVFRDVNKHYDSHRKRWLAELWRDYFGGPWLCAKFLAALVLLVLTFLQTYYTIYSYHHPR